MSGIDWVKTPCESAHCVEIGALPFGDFVIRNSQYPDVKTYFNRSELVAFIHAAKIGTFDKLVGLE